MTGAILTLAFTAVALFFVVRLELRLHRARAHFNEQCERIDSTAAPRFSQVRERVKSPVPGAAPEHEINLADTAPMRR